MNNQDLLSPFQRFQQHYLVYKHMLEEAYLHDKFIIKKCIMHPQYYANLMSDELIKTYSITLHPEDLQSRLLDVPIEISHKVDNVEWLVEFK